MLGDFGPVSQPHRTVVLRIKRMRGEQGCKLFGIPVGEKCRLSESISLPPASEAWIFLGTSRRCSPVGQQPLFPEDVLERMFKEASSPLSTVSPIATHSAFCSSLWPLDWPTNLPQRVEFHTRTSKLLTPPPPLQCNYRTPPSSYAPAGVNVFEKHYNPFSLAEAQRKLHHFWTLIILTTTSWKYLLS